jgi:NAD/NADP transhydrogenase beta subunit
MSSSAWSLPCKNLINLASLCGYIGLIYTFLTAESSDVATNVHWATAGLACWMGVHLVASVGGGDMPVCITVLNSYSGWALVAEGFMLNNGMLTIVGSLIGFSGAILTFIMCKAMNRDIFNVIFGGMNQVAPAKKDPNAPADVHTEIQPDQVAELLADAKEVMIIPGYGMAVARAQAQVAAIATTCRNNGVNVRFAIHPVAGRMPGQMNVLLAEANVPYDWVFEMDEVNDDMKNIDVCLIVGANDITNKAAQDLEGCPIYGMPVLKVWECKKSIFFKRSMKPGYADIRNPVFYFENTDMCLGNADKTCQDISNKLSEAFAVRK